ncbi:hematopoietic prostaglandin D synthase-like [Corticium candelabrum]|uniref:hematopoietic prostaglandin D synthase-like n=1 Tax=Corticium candelabrum TaxID=121492 RepID=UPI002E25B9A1|nr:hematopoietic prostaglandin D synthase-like [Corticium candelabrum]
MPSYKLTYFPVRGRAELARIIFHYTKTPFEDIRVKGEEWQALKKSGKPPFGFLPILEVDGTVISSSSAIVLYISEVTGLVGDTLLDKARGVMVMDAIGDLLNPFLPKFFQEQDPSKKAELAKEFCEKTLSPWIEKLNVLYKQNGQGDAWFVGSKLTYVDLGIFNLFDFLSTMFKKDANELLGAHPKLLALCKRVKELPKVAAYLESRPPM